MNTDWNSPQGDFDTAEKQGELLMLLSRQQVTVHTWDDPDFDYMEEQDLAWLNEYHAQVYEKIAPYLDTEEAAWLKEVTRPLSK